MITSVTGVTRNAGIDLPTPARAPAPPPAAEQPPAAASGATREAQAARTPQAAPAEGQDGRKGERKPEQQDAPDPRASADTSRYLADLLTARVLGTNLDAARPAHITPERLSSLISYLEASLRPPAGAPREPAGAAAGSTSEGVDVTS